MKLFYDVWYRFGRPPWVIGPREELVRLVDQGRLTPCRAIDLGCGTGDNAIFLAQRGFHVTGVDYAPAAIAKAKRKAAEAGVQAEFVVDDLTNLRLVSGPFDLLVDYGTLDDLPPPQRDRYLQQVLALVHPESQFLLWCFEWRLRWWERLLTQLLPFGHMALAPGEAERRFGAHFEMERVAGATDLPGWPRGYAAYLMRFKESSPTRITSAPPA